MSNTNVRVGIRGDEHRLMQLDPFLTHSEWRSRLLRGALTSGGCLVAEISKTVLAYAIWDHGFYGRGWVHLIFVSEHARRRGLGNRLLAACEERCPDRDVFLSTNLSNAPMRALAQKREYIESGLVHGLDPDDPEVFYRKEVVLGMRREDTLGIRG